MDEQAKILAIDDSEDVLFLIESIIASDDIEVVSTTNAKSALEMLDQTYDVIILDLMMPIMSGEEFLTEFKKMQLDIPVIILTAGNYKDTDISKFFEKGANDYINKPFQRAEFTARIKNFIQLKKAKDKQNEYNKRLRKKNKALQHFIKKEEVLNQKILRRTMKLKKAYKKIENLNSILKHSSTHDALTEILNRGAILTFLDNDIQRTKRINTKISIVMFDIDYFKKVNDTYGHLAGDEVLKQISSIVKTNIRDIDLFGRYGGEEFLIILPDTNSHSAAVLTERLLNKIRETKFDIGNNKTIPVTVSMGIAEYKNGMTIDKFIEKADESLYYAKEHGRNQIKVYEYD